MKSKNLNRILKVGVRLDQLKSILEILHPTDEKSKDADKVKRSDDKNSPSR